MNLIQKWTADQKEVAGRIDGLYQDLAEKEPGLPPFIDPEYPPLMKAFRESCASLKKHLSERLAADKVIRQGYKPHFLRILLTLIASKRLGALG